MSEDDFPDACFLKIQQRAISRVHDSVGDKLQEEYFSLCESPIEKVLMLALITEIEYGYLGHRYLYFIRENDNIDELEICSDWWISISGDYTLFIIPQSQLDGWRVDFLIITTNHWSRKKHKLIVECDGHEFHERTKRQAARDRARDRKFQAEGYTVFRFTGSEIWCDPCLCAEQITEWADKAKYSDKPKINGGHSNGAML